MNNHKSCAKKFANFNRSKQCNLQTFFLCAPFGLNTEMVVKVVGGAIKAT